MDEVLIPGTTVEYPESEYPGEESDFSSMKGKIYQGYTSPSDQLLFNVAYLVDDEFRQAVKKWGKVDWAERRTPQYETFFADMARERLGISFGTEYRFPAGLNARRFQQYFMRCCSNGENASEAERKNLNRFFSILKELNPIEFEKLEGIQLSDQDKIDVIRGVASKFTMEDINYFLHRNRTEEKRELIPGAPFIMSETTKEKLNRFLETRGLSPAYLNDFGDCHDIPDQDLKIMALMGHSDKVIKNEIEKNPDRFFEAIEKSSNPLQYAQKCLKSFFPDGIEISAQDRAKSFRLFRMYSDAELASGKVQGVYARLLQIKWRELRRAAQKRREERKAAREREVANRRREAAERRQGHNPVRKGLSKVLGLISEKLPPTQGRQTIKRALVKGYRFFYPKSGPDK